MTDSLHVLVVEDTDDDIQVISQLLKHHGIDVTVAHNGTEAIQLLEDIHPDVIVTDLAMPEMDGWDVLRFVKGDPHTQNIPVIAITAYHSVEVAREVERAGFDAYYPKPVSTSNFVTELEGLV